MQTPHQPCPRSSFWRIPSLLLFVGLLLSTGCKTFDYTDSDLERERQQLKKGSGADFNNPSR